MTTPVLGSLCSGYGGLDLAVEQVFGSVRTAWHAEIDQDASKILAAHWPGVPNLGDLADVQFSSVERVDILTAGYPCQPLSLAGRRRGFEDERWLWTHVARAVRMVRPRLVFLENVPGHLSMGFGRVLADLASLGYVGSWLCVRASDVGATHKRERVFILAEPADTLGERGRLQPVVEPGGGTPAGVGADGPGGLVGLDLLPTPNATDSQGGPRALPERRTSGGPDHGPRLRDVAAALLPTPTCQDAANTAGPAQLTRNSLPLNALVSLLPTPRATDGTKGGPNQRGSSGDLMLPSAVMELLPERWGRYAAAVARWEQVTGRPAPDPTEPGTRGQPRLSPRFVEWMMGLPAGWVTAHVGRNAALKALGNGVVPAQGAYALRGLLATSAVAA